MATLEKIRSKSVFLFIIIIVALLAFILGDFLTSGRSYFGTGTTMMSAGSNKVDYNDYKNVSENMSRNNQNSNQDAAEMEQLILKQLLMQQMIEEQYQQLGINVTDDQISRMMTTSNPYTAQFINYVAQQLGLPAANGSVVLDAINNPSRYGLTPEIQATLQQMWIAQENQLEATLKQQAFMSLINGLFTANEVDAQALYNDNMASTVVSMVSTPLASVADDQIEITNADLKEKWEELKPYYTLSQASPSGVVEPMRAIDYVVVNIEPSSADYNAAETEVDNAIAALNEQPGIEGLSGRAKFMHETVVVPVSKIKQNEDLRMLPDSALKKNAVHKFRYNRAKNTFTVAKVQDLRQEVDSINLSMYQAMDAAEADSIKGVLASGTAFSEVVANAQQGQAVDGVWQTLVGAPEDIKGMMLAEKVGSPFIYSDSTQGINVVYVINDRKKPVDYAEVSVIKYAVDPSSTTISDIKTQLNSFLASNAKGELFSANADSLYTLQHGFVSASSPKIGNVADTRRAVKWAMKAKDEEVSHIFEGKNAYLIVAVKDIYDGDYLPYNAAQINDVLRNQVRNDKKAAKLIEQYAGKANDLQGYAQLMNAEVRTDSAVVFTGNRVGNLMPNAEYALQGEIASAQEGQLIGPIQGASEVIVFVAGPTNTNGRPYDFAQDGRTFMSNFGLNFDRYGRQPIDQVMFEMLLGDRKVKNSSLNFVADEN